MRVYVCAIGSRKKGVRCFEKNFHSGYRVGSNLSSHRLKFCAQGHAFSTACGSGTKNVREKIGEKNLLQAVGHEDGLIRYYYNVQQNFSMKQL